jgi:hypothetical protein
MKNFSKFLGIAVMVAVIGFSFAACGEKEGGDGISWAGTWKMEGSNKTFTLGANGAGWAFDGNPVSTENGREWKTENNYMYTIPTALLFQQNGSTWYWYSYERISSTKIRITSGSQDNPLNGNWEKQ